MTKTIKPPFLRTPYNYDRDEASDESGLACKDPSLTQQQFAEESDINFIAERFGLGEIDPALWQAAVPNVLQPPAYGDFSGIFDFQQAQNAVRQALEGFMTLPAKLRTRFDNDPQKLIAFLDNPDNRKEAEFLGLVQPAPHPSESPRSDAGGADKGDTLSPADKPSSGAPDKSPKPPKKDT